MVQERNRIQLPLEEIKLAFAASCVEEQRESYIADDFIMEMQRG